MGISYFLEEFIGSFFSTAVPQHTGHALLCHRDCARYSHKICPFFGQKQGLQKVLLQYCFYLRQQLYTLPPSVSQSVGHSFVLAQLGASQACFLRWKLRYENRVSNSPFLDVGRNSKKNARIEFCGISRIGKSLPPVESDILIASRHPTASLLIIINLLPSPHTHKKQIQIHIQIKIQIQTQNTKYCSLLIASRHATAPLLIIINLLPSTHCICTNTKYKYRYKYRYKYKHKIQITALS